MKHPPIILSIAGSDCSGGAGIQADIKTISALGGYAATAITAITEQNTLGISRSFTLPPESIFGQIEAIMSDLKPDAIKIGMIPNTETARIIIHFLQKYKPKHVVLDPVMVSSSGQQLMEENTIRLIARELLPLTEVFTPNLNETEVLIGKRCRNIKEMKDAAQRILSWGSNAVLIKGGHLDEEQMSDVLLTSIHHKAFVFSENKIISCNTHGTGCTLSSAIATFLAFGEQIPIAVEKAKSYTTAAIAASKDLHIGEGKGSLNHFHNPLPMKIIE